MISTAVNIQGNILTYDILERITRDEEQFQAPKDYGFTDRSEILGQLESSWGVLKSQYQTFKLSIEQLDESDSGISVTKKFWMDPFLSELGYEIERNKEGQIINDRNYYVSDSATNLDGFPVHIIGANHSLDKKYTGKRMSAHALIQEYLNHHVNLYALVTNGKKLRLLRDSSLLTKVSYVEFDLEKMFSEDQFSDFIMMWKLIHFTRMPEEPEKGPESIIETYHNNGLESGSRIREKLSEAVKVGIETLGNGLLQENKNKALRDWIIADQANADRYYEQLLRFIYRLLFLMVIEERDLVYPEKMDKAGLRKKHIYYNYYSVQRLRKLALKHYYGNEVHYDLWDYLQNVFSLFEGAKGQKLGIQALAGDLFSAASVGQLKDTRLNNELLLQVIKGLNLFENDQGQFIQVNYKSLDVEEFGSVYEGLLELDPAVDTQFWKFSFLQGEGRSISGSHYTPDELVQPLIKHSLEHLITDILAERLSDEEKIKKLLSLTVCDVACGSGHILLAAARRIGLEVARLRTGEEQPNPESTRRGTRDAIQHCIYGVDKNPLAVELCKVAMWLEAHVPGEPLNFLDHKIKNGDAIVGLAHMDELYNGIATEAFKAYADEEKENCRLLKAANRTERRDREAGQLRLDDMKEIVEHKLKSFTEKFNAFKALPENTVEEIEAKKKAYNILSKGGNWWFVKNLADLQVAQFFVDKSDRNNTATDSDYFDVLAGRKKQTQAETMALVESTKRKFFHWFLEFPEVFTQGGFDCILGNPPFLGGQKISGAYGKNFAEYLKKYYEPIGSVDLVTYFFRRIFDIIRPSGFQSLISTNTIAQGDARLGGLAVILENGGVINHAVRSMKWPGLAAVEVALITIYKDIWNSTFILDWKKVERITSYLDDQEFLGDPYPLVQNEGKSFQGSIVLGKGFVLEPEEAQRLIEKDPKNREVLFPYLNGQDLNNQVDQSPTRWVINFFDWPEEKAKQYSDCFSILLDRVKPERQKQKDRWAKENWWLHLRPRPDLYRTIASLERVLVVALTSNTLKFSFDNYGTVFSHSLGVLALDRYQDSVLLNSMTHQEWSWRYGSGMKGDLRYTPSDVFETFPFPQSYNSQESGTLDELGFRYDNVRSKIMNLVQLGLTKSYNQFHNPTLKVDASKDLTDLNNTQIKQLLSKESWNLYKHLKDTEGTISFQEAAQQIEELRQLQVQMDQAVLEAYGWHIDTKRWGPAIDLRHDFYEVDYLPENDRIRFTIHPDARKEVLKRLLLLNHEIHESEERGISYEELDAEKIMEIYKEQINAWLERPESLHPRTLKFLASGEDLLPTLETSTAKSYKPFVSQYCSALENELSAQIFVPFHEQIYLEYQPEESEENKEKLLTYIKEQIAIKPASIGGIGKRLKSSNTDTYELGTMKIVLDLIKNPNGNTLGKSELLQKLRAFIKERYSEGIFDQEFLTSIENLTMNYRNPAAHTGEVNRQMAVECMDLVRQLINSITSNQIDQEPIKQATSDTELFGDGTLFEKKD